LAENRKCFDRVVPRDQDFDKRKYKGIFRFRFFRFNTWVEVVVDDLLPTRNGKLIYLRSRETNEFWGPLLEKAYAKLYGSYKELDGGLAVEAGVDFTGGIPEVISLDARPSDEEKKLFSKLKGVSQQKDERFLSSSLEGRSNMGLEARHAYSITGFFELMQRDGRKVRLVRVRNPHGNEDEWRGAWGDKDEDRWSLISDADKQKLKIFLKTETLQMRLFRE